VLGFGWLAPVLSLPVIGDVIKAGTVVWSALFLMNIWNFIGINALYWTAGLNSIDQELYEAAAIDGASALQRFWHVTLPLLRPMTLFIIIQAIAGSFAVFAQPFLLTGGGPADATLTLSLYLYQQGFSVGNFGYANAIGYSMALITLVLSLLNLWLFREQEERQIRPV
jgi:ABC-type sugar transport system permease subunit